MPISNIHFDSTVVGPAGNEARHKLVMWCSRDDLLRNFKGWGPQVRRELAAHPELFDITPYLNETLTCLRRIEIVVLKEDVPELVEFAHYLHQLVAEVARDGFRAVILSRGGANETRLEHLPLHVVDHFLAAAFPGRYPPVNQAVRFGLGNITVTRRTAE